MKKLIFLLTILCSIFLLNGCGTTSSETDKIIGEWGALTPGSFIKVKIEKNNNDYIYTGKAYQVIMQKESAASKSPLVVEITDSNDYIIDKNNVKLTKTEDEFTFYIGNRKASELKYDPKTNTISQAIGANSFKQLKPIKNITEQEKKKWAKESFEELANTYRAKRDGEYGIIDKIDLSLIK